MQRRRFIQICSTAAAGCAALELGPLPAWAADVPDVPQPPVLLTDAQGAPLKASALGTSEAYVFSYPYASTPAFLIRLGAAAQPARLSADGQSYDWPGGVGPDKTIVAYTAICAHQLSYPEKDSSVIAYDPKATQVSGKPGMIVCCAHQSVYDPAEGAKVMSGAGTASAGGHRAQTRPERRLALGHRGHRPSDFRALFQALPPAAHPPVRRGAFHGDGADQGRRGAAEPVLGVRRTLLRSDHRTKPREPRGRVVSGCRSDVC